VYSQYLATVRSEQPIDDSGSAAAPASLPQASSPIRDPPCRLIQLFRMLNLRLLRLPLLQILPLFREPSWSSLVAPLQRQGFRLPALMQRSDQIVAGTLG